MLQKSCGAIVSVNNGSEQQSRCLGVLPRVAMSRRWLRGAPAGEWARPLGAATTKFDKEIPMKSRGAGAAERGFDYEIKKKGGRIASSYAEGGKVKTAVHKHEKALHPGKPLTKLARGGMTPKMPRARTPMMPRRQAMMFKGGSAKG